MLTYLCTYQVPRDLADQYFRCEADSAEHALEQLKNAEPDVLVGTIRIGIIEPVTAQRQDKESEEYLISVLEAVREALQDNDVDGALLMIKTALGEGRAS